MKRQSELPELYRSLSWDNIESQPAQPMGDCYLFGIGIDAYPHFTPLNNAVKDVLEVFELLQSYYQFDKSRSQILLNEKATRKQIIDSLAYYRSSIREQDSLIIYYSGHGDADGQYGYWVPYDVAEGEESKFILEGTIKFYLETIKARHILLISDSCFSGALLGGPFRGEVAIRDWEKRNSRFILASGQADERVTDGAKGKNSPFASSIMDVLLDHEMPLLNVGYFVDQVIKRTREKAKQEPIGGRVDNQFDKGGQFVFRRKHPERFFWRKAQESDSLIAYETFLEKFPEGDYAENAQQAIARIQGEKPWQMAKQKDTLEAYRDFLDQFPGSKFALEAIKRIEAFEDEQFWEKASKEHTLHGYYEYLHQFPEGEFADEAKQSVAIYPKRIGQEEEGQLVLVEEGAYWRGGHLFNREQPIHTTQVKGFRIAKHPVTFLEYDAFCIATNRQLADDAGWGRENRPVINVNWYEAIAYCNWRSKEAKLDPAYTTDRDGNVLWHRHANGFRLLTEAEWEFAAKGGVEDEHQAYIGSNIIEEVSWYQDNAGDKTQPVGMKMANELGLFDMGGNVYEWCYDFWDYTYYKQFDKKIAIDPIGPSTGELRLLRGGSFSSQPAYCRASYRKEFTPDSRRSSIGFRIGRNA